MQAIRRILEDLRDGRTVAPGRFQDQRDLCNTQVYNSQQCSLKFARVREALETVSTRDADSRILSDLVKDPRAGEPGIRRRIRA